MDTPELPISTSTRESVHPRPVRAASSLVLTQIDRPRALASLGGLVHLG
ncbi:MAG: hypothetical protein HY829_11390 [Actinobacteria bacterium]|nr:hypothetical protein [Actinomycetota bacterium]